MFSTSREEVYQDGEVIFAEGSYGENVYVVKSGEVRVSKKLGDKTIVIEVLKAGYFFGELGFIAKKPRTATVKAVGETVVGILDEDLLDEEFNNLSEEFQTMLRSLVLRLDKTTQLALRAASLGG
jgi:CRP-like cAMP-binding protein